MKPLLTLLLLVPLAACGGDDSSSTPDAGLDGGGISCVGLGAPAGTIDSFPGNFSGSVTGGGADLTVAEGVCTVDNFFDNGGEDVVIELTGLTSGGLYAAVLGATDEDDLGFYVLSGCEITAGAVTGACDLYQDLSLSGEEATFTASGTSAWIVVDTSLDAADLTSGDFTLDVFTAECEDDTGCSGSTPSCVDFNCVECATDFECDAATPSCDRDTNTCVAGHGQCTGDDARDTTAPGDDGPTVATALTVPTVAATPTVISDGAVCSAPAAEADYFTFTTAADLTYGFGLTWASTTADLDVYITDAEGLIVEAGVNFDQEPEGFLAALDAGTYYVMVVQYAPAGAVAASPYTLTMSIPECTDNFDCNMAEPVCSAAGTCGVGPTTCTGDDAGDTTGGGDDGPLGGRSLTGAIGVPAPLTAQGICNVGAGEVDFYQVTTTAPGEGLTVDLAWAGTEDLDILILDNAGTVLGASFWKQPETVTLSFLPMGTYYIQVSLIAPADTVAAAPYSITATRNAVGNCNLAAGSCGLSYSTQVYRGACAVDGSCNAIITTGGANNSACDSAADCTSGACSYILFEKDAEKSVCTTTCTTTADCSALPGTTCTTGFGTNRCLPACADDLSCGADFQSETIDTGEPWDYYVCTTPGATGTCGP